MEWIKIPTDSVLYSEFKNHELLVIIKYQALFCQLEKEPSESQLSRIFTKKELKFIESYKEVVQELCESQINSVARKRNKDKENYKQKQSVSKNSASGKEAESERNGGADKIREDKRREEEKKERVERKKFSAVAPAKQSSGYAFEGKVIRLTEKDFDGWQKSFPDLNMRAELMVRDDWLSTQPEAVQKRWFQSTASFFIKQNAMRKAQNDDEKTEDLEEWLKRSVR